MRNNLKILIMAVVVTAITSCTNQNSSVTQNTKEYTSEYICPMHCEGSGSDSSGICPVCGMDYIENTEKEKK